jgi:hypothetical protein
MCRMPTFAAVGNAAAGTMVCWMAAGVGKTGAEAGSMVCWMWALAAVGCLMIC